MTNEYKDMYYQLFNKITDIIEELKEIQIKMEEMYIESDCQTDSKVM